VSIDPGSGLAAMGVFCGNSLFDPATVHTTNQPRGFDQMGLLFLSYLVLKCRLKATFVNSSETVLDQYVCFVALMNTATTTTSLSSYAEQRNSTIKSMGPEQGQLSITKTMYPAKQLGFPNGGRNEEDLKGTPSNDPPIRAFFHVGASSAEGTDPGAITVLVEMEFWALWTHPTQPGPSN